MAAQDVRVDGERLRALRLERGLTQEELEALSGVTQGHLTKLERGLRPWASAITLAKLAAALGVEIADLLVGGGVEGEQGKRRTRPDEAWRILESSMPILVPEYGPPVSAGSGVPVEVDVWSYYPAEGERGHRFEAFEVVGDCMAPLIQPGHRVMADLSVEARPGDLVVAEHDGQRIIKRLVSVNKHLELQAERGQPPIVVDESTVIVGVVKQVMYRV